MQLLSNDLETDDFATSHDLVRRVHSAVMLPERDAVLSWLTARANFVPEPGGRDLLWTFARRYAGAPVDVTREHLRRIRDLLADVPASEQTALGRSLGQALRIEAQRVVSAGRSGRVTSPERALPSETYLPASIEDQRDGWSAAADGTPGLVWSLPAYAEALKIPGRSFDERGGRRRGAKRFLGLLGANTSPRMVKVETPVTPQMPALQREAPQRLGRAPGSLVEDYISPDLELVVSDIVAGSPDRRPSRRAGARGSGGAASSERGVSFFRSLSQAWGELEHLAITTARRDSRRGQAVEVPSTWVARLAEEPWLTTRAGQAERPIGLAIATKVTNAMSDDPAGFAAGLGQSDAESPLASALGMSVDPPASRIVQSIETYRSMASPGDAGNVLRLYRALAGHCPAGPNVPPPNTVVSDMTVSSLRGRFGISSKRSGLIAGCATTMQDDRWYAPSAVHAGKDVFHRRQPFVLTDRELAPLWLTLNIAAPGFDDCLRELDGIASLPPSTEMDAVLIDVYRHLDRMLEWASATQRRALRGVPLLCNGAWTKTRPIYTSPFPDLVLEDVSVWAPPCAIGTMQRFVNALDVIDLPVRSEPLSPWSTTPDELQHRFDVAVRLLKASLAKEDEISYRAVMWNDLVGMLLHLHDPGQLQVVVEPNGSRGVPVAVRAHADRRSKAIHIDGADAIGRFEYGGQAVAAFAEPSRRREIALAWVSAWASSVDAPFEATINLAEDEEEGDFDVIAAMFDRLKRSNGRRKMPTGGEDGGRAVQADRKIEVRRLKAASDEFVFKAELRDGVADGKKGPQVRKDRPLRQEEPSQDKTAGGEAGPASASAHRQYDSIDLQKRGWQHLLMAVADGQIAVSDFQSLKDVGADGAIDWRTFVEMKATGREPPGQVSMTEKEFLRAKERKGQYLLVVVSGLENDFKTQIAIYENPLASLHWTVKGSVSLGGLATGRALVLTQSEDMDQPSI